MTRLRLKVPADAITIAITRHLVAACNAVGVPSLLVGATARVLVLQHVLGLAPGRATRDVDFAVAVQRWEQFDALKERLVATGHFRQSHDQKQRMYFSLGEIPVDLVPFGGIARPGSVIAWPPEMAIQLCVVGYEDALHSALEVELEKELWVRVASLPGQALLKIQAWVDRRAATGGKDARDLAILLRTYEQADLAQRIYAQGDEVGSKLNWEPELMGARLLGRDAKELASEETLRSIQSILCADDARIRIEMDMAREFVSRDDALAFVRRLLDAFVEGLT